MNFAEVRFWQLLVEGLTTILLGRVVIWKCRPESLGLYDKIALLALGLFLLMCVSWVTLIIFLVVAIGSYYGLKWIVANHEPERSKRYLWLLIPVQLLPLLYYKYANFFANQIVGLSFTTLRSLIIPVGISFYTFQKVAFVVDTLCFRKPLPHFLDYLNFAGFVPQIVVGLLD